MTVGFVCYNFGSSLIETINIMNDIKATNQKYLAHYPLSVYTCASMLRVLETKGPYAARITLWSVSKSLYWDHVHNTMRSKLEVRDGAYFKKFVDSTPSLRPLVDADSKNSR